MISVGCSVMPNSKRSPSGFRAAFSLPDSGEQSHDDQHPSGSIAVGVRDRICCLRRPVPGKGRRQSHRRAQRAHRDGDLAAYGFNGPHHTGHDQRDRIPRRGNGDGRCQGGSVVVVNSTTITAIVPARPAGAADVVVTNPGGLAGALAAAFIYSLEEPVTVTPGTDAVDAGGQLSVSWTAPGARAGDWIALFPVGGSYDDDWWGAYGWRDVRHAYGHCADAAGAVRVPLPVGRHVYRRLASSSAVTVR